MGKRADALDRHYAEMSKEEISAQQRIAGQRSAQARKEKKAREHTISAALKVLMEGNYLTDEHRAALVQRGLDPDEIDGAMAVAAAMYDRAAVSADTQAARFVAEYTEGKATEKVEIGGLDGKPIESIDLTKMTDDQLKMLIAKRKNSD
jgi:hypothetical protein